MYRCSVEALVSRSPSPGRGDVGSAKGYGQATDVPRLTVTVTVTPILTLILGYLITTLIDNNLTIYLEPDVALIIIAPITRTPALTLCPQHRGVQH